MKTICLFSLLFCTALPLWAANTVEHTAGTALWITALLTAVIHTLAGPDHYLPFIAIAKSRDYSLKKTMLWTFLCGFGHVGSALLIALIFVYFSHWLGEEQFEFIEEYRGDIAAYSLVGLGLAYLLWALRHKLMHKTKQAHNHVPADSRNITVGVLFIIFVLGPCEALLPILTASSVLGVGAVIYNTLIFSIATIATMMLAVTFGLKGIRLFNLKSLSDYAHELAGATIMACGIAILCGL